MMSVRRRAAYAAIVAAGVVATVVFVRNLGCDRGRARPLHEAPAGVRPAPFRCNRCKHEFVGYEVQWVPATAQQPGLRRYRRPGDKQWTPATDKEAVERIKAVVCPECGAKASDLTMFLEVDAPAP